ncbi:MAG: type II toxin-antitoxin system RelE/ParE family toxin [Microcoleus sp. PH2017_29_MFU_D_A]|uniref:type II toxin-antitoxin system RelE family toxin n=1 Tax=unclassified Microcoleus TaxID=2642155 RepID=UPI001D552C23|nr:MULTISPECIES: type II toxin-antitoxin system RelE/ParE family toxin [unclassified Microcoleus]MCC3419076.1 type II toxin-antitoxin system RelE/ParE family toxin [Microcoleus sp. PH2017_07_MST_O_A]MCC3429209.1 type II toxin-antitoxin system RelE/ParE family toxin [Microcoleus sp. PH2017_04_SCI_O_A]MCC3445600.1 type II toxin-antitoxin system RelE/ParE family toxin [Microcoleus sp. PH2017_03_ELD_O_A]MCC3468657.1 type II toxin-antitoxin system RelE/ParE family toxin [Microcoleus sp. PH2017_06_SF
MTNSPLVEIRLTPEFQRKLKNLAKKYRQIPTNIQPVLEQLQVGEFLGDRIPDIGFPVMKVRIRNSDTQKGKSGGYRLIYWISSTTLIVLLDIYSKSEREDIEIEEIRQIIKGFSTTPEETDA